MIPLNSEEQKEIKNIEELYYMQAILRKILEKIHFLVGQNDREEKKAWVEVLNYLSEIFSNSEKDVREIQLKRKEKGEIRDVPQTMKTIAGSAFSKANQYLFLKNK